VCGSAPRLTVLLLGGLLALAALAPHDGAARPSAPPPPQQGASVNIEPTSGITFYRAPGQPRKRLTAEIQVPVDTIVDATNGRMGVTSTGGVADFFGGAFVIRQPKRRRQTQLWLAGPDPKACKARTARVVRALWGDGKGDFQTRGLYAAATVRGTRWLVQDRCDGTLTRVVRGIVAVRDFKRGRTVVLRAGQSYLAPR
jgi:hypothetical protein